MATYDPPRLPEPEELSALGPALDLLARLQTALAGYRVVAPPIQFDLPALDPPNRAMLEQTLGQGEVAGTLQVDREGGLSGAIGETRLAGVWWVSVRAQVSAPAQDYLEVADLPTVARALAFVGAVAQVGLPEPIPPGVMNAPGVLAEVNGQAARYQAGARPHVINLTLLPQTPEDLVCLDAALGRGTLGLLSRGYGTCRVTSTRLRHGWRVRHFNSEDRLILDTIEVTDVPVAVLAAQEDIDDSAVRLADILKSLR